jgi:hypothetical protein
MAGMYGGPSVAAMPLDNGIENSPISDLYSEEQKR